MIRRIFSFLVISICIAFSLNAQEKNTEDGYRVFYHPNGNKSSEGVLRDGKPDGYWKNYSEEGILISEGNRKDFLLDSTWKFYNDSSRLILEINYSKGRKNGWRVEFSPEEIIRTYFLDDIKDSITEILYPGGQLKMEIPYEDGLENGMGKEYDTNGLIISVITYKKGYKIKHERINRYDRDGKRYGPWKFFRTDGSLKEEGTYSGGLMHGFFKYYDEEGQFLRIEKYVYGEIQKEAPETASLEMVREYYPNGKLKRIFSQKDNEQEGLFREYDSTGKLKQAWVFSRGAVIAEGMLDKSGQKDGQWKHYFSDGSIRASGKYVNGNKSGKWEYFYPNGTLEQKGMYSKTGKPHGEWLWFYPSGNLMRQEMYWGGKPDGMMTEYSDSATIIAQGNFVEGKEDGEWIYNYKTYSEKGKYSNGHKDETWIATYSNGNKKFIGEYFAGLAEGWHRWYWPNGRKKLEGKYSDGLKTGTWFKYNEEGLPVITITYDNGIETKYDGAKIKPPFEE